MSSLHRCLGFVLLGAAVVTAALADTPAAAPAGVWKTAFYKRGFVGKYELKWAGITDDKAVMRLPVFLPFDGSRVRVWVNSLRDTAVTLGHLSLAPGTDRQGGTDGRFFPVTFAGKPGLTIAAKSKDSVSDEVAAPVRAGQWYLQENYTSAQSVYAYDADGVFTTAAEGDKLPPADSFRKGSWAGNVYRIDVFTTDPRPVIVCYGDSITQGAYSTAATGNRYPALLGGLLNRPVLNLGVNGDQAKYGRHLMMIVKELEGVDTVVFLMGINDIISGGLAKPEDYIKGAAATVAEIKKAGLKCYLGTIMPAGGYAKFDADPAKEKLRQAINVWIRASSGADGVIDFDAALRDPKNPTRLRADWQHDWLHPNDTGYQHMAETAAAVLR